MMYKERPKIPVGIFGFFYLLCFRYSVGVWPVMQAFRESGYEDWAAGEMIPNYTYVADQIIYNTSAAMDRILAEKF